MLLSLILIFTSVPLYTWATGTPVISQGSRNPISQGARNPNTLLATSGILVSGCKQVVQYWDMYWENPMLAFEIVK